MVHTMTAPEDAEHVLFATVLKNKTEELELLSNWVRTVAEVIRFSSRGLFKLDLVLSEVVSNIIQYAFEDSDENEIVIELQFHGKTARIKIKDRGIPFDPTQSPKVELPTCLENAQIGGLGIHLIRNYCDELYYQRRDNVNTLTITICDTE